jgi:predicted phage replisome organizer
MIKKIPDQFWFPFWVDKWIFGSMRIEFNPVERAIWVDLLALAAKDDGYIRANKETPYLPEQLAGLLVYNVDDFKNAVEGFIKKEKIERDENGVLYITNWDKYKLTDSYKRVLKHRKVLPVETQSVTSVTENVTQIKSNQIKSNHINNGNTNVLLSPGFENIKQKWNTFAKENNLTTITEIKKDSMRYRHIKARLKEKYINKKTGMKQNIDFETVLAIVRNSPFLLGKKGKEPFYITFDWIIKPSNFIKIIEGNYLDKKYSGIAVWLKESEDG